MHRLSFMPEYGMNFLRAGDEVEVRNEFGRGFHATGVLAENPNRGSHAPKAYNVLLITIYEEDRGPLTIEHPEPMREGKVYLFPPESLWR
ncbi:MAG: hypothetical protein Q8P13_01835 [bacterium]|nr:hypothetical protein [bacterium]